MEKNLNKFKQHLEETSNEMAPLKVWQFQELSLQAAERIMNAPKEEALKVFTNTAQNFPMQVIAFEISLAVANFVALGERIGKNSRY